MTPSEGWEPPSTHVGPRSLRGLLDAVLTVGSDLDLAATLRRITEAAVALVDARYGALGVLDDAGTRLDEFITVGVDDDTHRAIGALPKGLGLLGAIINDASSRRLADLHEDPESAGFPPNHPPMTSFLGVPIRTRDRVFGNLYLTDKTTAEAFTDIDQELVQALAAAAAVAIDNARLHAETERRQATLAAFQQVAQALLDGAGRDDILGEIAARAKALAGADLAAIALPVPGSEQLRIDIAVGAGADSLHRTAFDRHASVSGQVLSTGETILLDDVSHDPRSGPFQRQGDLGPALFVPLEADDGPFGTLVVARRVDTRPFATFEQEIVSSFAGQASLVVHHERQRARIQDVALLEDRDRIARDLHDTVIQGVFATGLTLQGAARLIEEPAARDRVATAVDQLDEIARHIRTVIFGLETQRSATENLRRRALAVVEESGRAIGHEPRLGFDGPIDTVVGETLADEVVAVLRESLSNVARHARATAVEVHVTVTDVLTVTVADDGVGVDPAARRGNGLRNLRERAEAHGGTATLEPGADGGTVVTWAVPLTD
ncbi:MAG: GAF domain-containing protein [Acidimicrobiales bacterium]|nr:GAF domain-containing protein [Acidimicrobiales bacterium]